MSRSFTRADVAKFFEETFIHYEGGVTYHLQSVQLSLDFTTGAWLVNFLMDAGHEVMHHHQILIIQMEDDLGPSKPYLRFVNLVELPIGCVSVEKEDAQMKYERQELFKNIENIKNG